MHLEFLAHVDNQEIQNRKDDTKVHTNFALQEKWLSFTRNDSN